MGLDKNHKINKQVMPPEAGFVGAEGYQFENWNDSPFIECLRLLLSLFVQTHITNVVKTLKEFNKSFFCEFSEKHTVCI